MSVDLCDFYQEVIVDYGWWFCNFGLLFGVSYQVEGFNLLCGDCMSLYLWLVDGIIWDVCFEGVGCVILIVFVLLMIEVLIGCSEVEVEVLFDSFYDMLIGEEYLEMLLVFGKLEVLVGVW